MLFKKNIKGFTLVELLAVIVVLAIISLIGYSVVGNVISGAQESADKENVREYARSVRLAIVSAQSKGEAISELTKDWLDKNVNKTGSKVSCDIVKEKDGSIQLGYCSVGNSEKTYCFVDDQINECKIQTIDKIYGNTGGVGEQTTNLAPGFTSPAPTESNMSVYKFKVAANTTYSINFNSEKSALKTVWLYDNDNNITKLINYAYANSGYNKMVVIPKQDGYMSVGILDSDAKVMVAEGMYFNLNAAQQNNLNNNGITTSAVSGEVPYEPYGYKINITAKNFDKEDKLTIYLDESLGDVDYIDFTTGKVVRNDTESETISEIYVNGVSVGLADFRTSEEKYNYMDYKFETEVQPSNVILSEKAK